MALYAFDGTWNRDEVDDVEDTNVVRFREVYGGADFEYLSGVGTRFGTLGRIAGGLFGLGGRSRIGEMYDALTENWNQGDRDIDIIGFSRGAALAVHFANKIAEDGIETSDGTTVTPEIRFLGVWDVVGSFGLSFDTFINFQELNLGWDIDKVGACVKHCYHAMALDERRETFNVTRLDPEHTHDRVTEVWFRGVHSDVGGGNRNVLRSNISLQWMLDRAREAGLPINAARASEAKYSATDPAAPISENQDVQRDPRRKILDGDVIHESAEPKRLAPDGSHTCRVKSELTYNWSGVRLQAGAKYRVEVPPGQKWLDGSIECNAAGWDSERLPWYKEAIVERFESRRRFPEANWFELIGALGDEDDTLFRIGNGTEYTAPADGDLYLFANDLRSKYDNNEGWLDVKITRLS